jgi:chaperonin GroES
MNFTPLEDRLLVKPLPQESEKSDSGIILDMVKKEIAKGEVVAIGDGRYAPENGQFIPNRLIKGDIVIYGINQGMEITVEKQTYRILRESDVLLVVGKKEDAVS